MNAWWTEWGNTASCHDLRCKWLEFNLSKFGHFTFPDWSWSKLSTLCLIYSRFTFPDRNHQLWIWFDSRFTFWDWNHDLRCKSLELILSNLVILHSQTEIDQNCQLCVWFTDFLHFQTEIDEIVNFMSDFPDVLHFET